MKKIILLLMSLCVLFSAHSEAKFLQGRYHLILPTSPTRLTTKIFYYRNSFMISETGNYCVIEEEQVHKNKKIYLAYTDGNKLQKALLASKESPDSPWEYPQKLGWRYIKHVSEVETNNIEDIDIAFAIMKKGDFLSSKLLDEANRGIISDVNNNPYIEVLEDELNLASIEFFMDGDTPIFRINGV